MSSLYIIFACLLWAGDSLIRYPLVGKGISSTQIVFYEHLIAVSLLSLFFYKSFSKILKNKYRFSFFIIGALGSALATLSFTEAFSIMNPSVVILIQKLQPIVAIILASIILKEKVPSHFMIAALMAIIGAIFLNADYLDKLVFDFNVWGITLSLIAVLGWAGATVYGRKLSLNGLSEVEIMMGRFLWGTMMLIPFLAIAQLNNTIVSIDSLDAVKIFSLVLISGLIAMYAYYKGLRFTEAKIATILELFFPFFAVIINWVFLGQSLNLIQIAGGLILILSSTYMQLKKS